MFAVVFMVVLKCSYQQARSFGSALLFASGKLAVADIFTVDLAEEASAVFGDTLGDQITFLNDVVVTVKSFYAREFGMALRAPSFYSLYFIYSHPCRGCQRDADCTLDGRHRCSWCVHVESVRPWLCREHHHAWHTSSKVFRLVATP